MHVHLKHLILALALGACGCDSDKPAKPAPAQPAQPAANPHAAGPHAAGPHAGAAGAAANPHAAPAKTPEPVNPTDVTPDGKTQPQTVRSLQLEIPAQWTRREPKSSMRAAEFVIPGPGGEVVMAVFRFPGGGDVNSNIQRWKGQFQKTDGSPLGEADLKVDTSERAPLKLTTVEIAGTNIAPVRPGSAERYHQPDAKMFAIIVEGDGDPYFFKAVGPAKTVDVWAEQLPAIAKSITSGAAQPAAAQPAKPE